MKKLKSLLIALAVPSAAGLIVFLLVPGMGKLYGSLIRPALSPPPWLFGVMWPILYLLMGYASFLVYDSAASENQKKTALTWYLIQLALNFLWSFLFFGGGLFLLSFLELLLLLAAAIVTCILFYRIRKTSGALLIPYVLWILFAAYLNLQVWLLNG